MATYDSVDRVHKSLYLRPPPPSSRDKFSSLICFAFLPIPARLFNCRVHQNAAGDAMWHRGTVTSGSYTEYRPVRMAGCMPSTAACPNPQARILVKSDVDSLNRYVRIGR